jgi:hypothetical protein
VAEALGGEEGTEAALLLGLLSRAFAHEVERLGTQECQCRALGFFAGRAARGLRASRYTDSLIFLAPFLVTYLRGIFCVGPGGNSGRAHVLPGFFIVAQKVTPI